MKAVIRLVLLALVLVFVALVSALVAMRFAIHGHEVAVPNFAGMAPAQAERLALASGLQFQVERQYYSSEIPEGRIMSQLPEAGTKVRRGWQVRVAESLGAQRVAIPDVTGQTARAAEINIDRRGLDLGTIAAIPDPSLAPDEVLAQSPPANASGVSAPRISLLLSAAPPAPAYVMPNLVGQSLGSATQILQGAGMRLGTVRVTAGATDAPNGYAPQETTASPSSLILSQDPPAGQKITAGLPVNFEVSR